MVLLDPLQKRSRIVQAHADGGMAAEKLDERQIGALVGALDDIVKIAQRLVGVD
jgi:hypothetical protein